MAKMEIDLHTIQVIEKEDRSNDEAYIWCFGILVDANTTKSKNYVIKRNGSKYNLGDDFKKGEKRAIPDSTGKIACTVSPVGGKSAIAGVIVLMWEGDNTPDSAVKKSYADTAKVINDFVAKFVAAGKSLPEKVDFEKLQKDIQSTIAKNVLNTLKIYRPLRFDVDDFIGNAEQIFRILDCKKAQSHNLVFQGKEDDAHYKITGKFTFTP